MRVALAGGLGLWLAAGCGTQFDLPPQPEPIRIPEPGTYNRRTVWDLPTPTDLVVFGTNLYVVEESLRVGAYFSKRYDPDPNTLVAPFEDLIMPVQLALSISRGARYVIVADAGDMHCKIYSWQGGAPIHSFTDTTWTGFSGLAADDSLNIYVAEAARDTILAYNRQGFRIRVVSDFGTGSGYVIGPRGLAFTRAADGQKVLVVADTEKNWVQRLDPDTNNVALILEPIGTKEDELLEPWDVATDANGEFIFVADTGHDQVLKYERGGAFDDTVYSAAKIADVTPITAPRYVCSVDSLVFVSDPDSNRIVILELTSQ